MMINVSVIFIDWRVRESFHAINYLNRQTVPRSQYELIWVEYYQHRPVKLQELWAEGKFNKWVVLNKVGHYSKHLLYNEGVSASEGEIVVICDSDAMFSPTFIENIINSFEENKNRDIVLYLDEVRNENRCFFPFKDVSWEEAMNTPGLINWSNAAGKPYGLTTSHDIIHYRNYGACFCAKRKDIIAAGGFDEHSSYRCFFCGPYELGWRLVNKGYKEIWHQSEWLLHVWHPWVRQGVDILGESDGRGLNATALEVRKTGRVDPLLANEKIHELRMALGPVKEYPERTCTRVSLRGEIKEDSYRWRKSTRNLGMLVRCIVLPAKVRRVLILSEIGSEKDLYKSLYHAGVAARVETFYYDQVYHNLNYELMVEALIAKCRGLKPDLVIFVPLKEDPYLSSEEKIAPGEEVFKVIAQEMGIKVITYDDDLRYLSMDQLNFYHQGLERDIDVCFWGSISLGSRREEYLSYLRDNGISVCTRDYRLPVERYADILNRSKIVLSINQENDMTTTPTRRELEIMACNCLLVAEEFSGVEKMFQAGIDYVTFRGKEDLLEKVKYYLSKSEERRAIASSGYGKVMGIHNVRNLWLNALAEMGFRRSYGMLPKMINMMATITIGAVKRVLRYLAIRVVPKKYLLPLKALARRLHFHVVS